jgi:hypothetical protein
MTPEMLAQRFHETYERLAPQFGYETRRESAKPWSEVPENNKQLMVAVCGEIAARLERLEVVMHWAQAVLTAWNISDLMKESLLHKKLREVMIAFREQEALDAAK